MMVMQVLGGQRLAIAIVRMLLLHVQADLNGTQPVVKHSQC